MTSIHVPKWAAIGILILNVILTVATINMGAFAAKGPRYTALDGKREESERVLADLELQRQQEAERQQRIVSDLALAARVDELHNLLAERCDDQP